MKKFALFCKSYHKDVYRAKRLADSIDQYNRDGILFVMSVPKSDFDLFKDILGENECVLVSDEEIINASCEVFGDIPGFFYDHLYQQLIKLEFWRIGMAENYGWIDSDSYFIKEFHLSDFMYDNKTPYTIMDEYNTEILKEKWKNIAAKEMEKRVYRRAKQVNAFKSVFGNTDQNWDFGISTPIIWASQVLKHLHQNYLIPKNKTIFELLSEHPTETFLYGYYLIHSQCMPIYPKSHMFRAFDYADEFIEAEINGENEASISKNYFGMCIQSNWALFKEKKPLARRLRNRKQDFMNGLRKLKSNFTW